jgi:hypothetical protein
MLLAEDLFLAHMLHPCKNHKWGTYPFFSIMHLEILRKLRMTTLCGLTPEAPISPPHPNPCHPEPAKDLPPTT